MGHGLAHLLQKPLNYLSFVVCAWEWAYSSHNECRFEVWKLSDALDPAATHHATDGKSEKGVGGISLFCCFVLFVVFSRTSTKGSYGDNCKDGGGANTEQ